MHTQKTVHAKNTMTTPVTPNRMRGVVVIFVNSLRYVTLIRGLDFTQKRALHRQWRRICVATSELLERRRTFYILRSGCVRHSFFFFSLTIRVIAFGEWFHVCGEGARARPWVSVWVKQVYENNDKDNKSIIRYTHTHMSLCLSHTVAAPNIYSISRK